MIDLKSDTTEKDRLHTEILDTAKTMDEKMTVEKASVGTKYEEEVTRLPLSSVCQDEQNGVGRAMPHQPGISEFLEARAATRHIPRSFQGWLEFLGSFRLTCGQQKL